MDTNYWTAINHFFIWGSIAIYFCILFAMHSDGIFDLFPHQFPSVGNGRHSLGQVSAWLAIVLTTVICVMPVVIIRYLKVDLNPSLSYKVQYLQKTQGMQAPAGAYMRRGRRNSSKRSSYAFAHQEGYGELITSGKNMRFCVGQTPSTHGQLMPCGHSWIDHLRKNTVETVNTSSNERSSKQ